MAPSVSITYSDGVALADDGGAILRLGTCDPDPVTFQVTFVVDMDGEPDGVWAMPSSAYDQPYDVRTVRQPMVVAVNHIKRVCERADPPDMGFLPGIHIGCKSCGEFGVAKNMYDFFYSWRGGAVEFSKSSGLKQARHHHITYNVADPRTTGTRETKHKSLGSDCTNPIAIARRIVDHEEDVRRGFVGCQ